MALGDTGQPVRTSGGIGGGDTLESPLEPQVAMGTSVSTEGRPSAHRVMGWHGRIVAGGDTGQRWVGGR